jgi:hypothetical protein
MLALLELKLVAEKLVALVFCKKAVVKDALVAEKLVALVFSRKAVVNDALVAEKLTVFVFCKKAVFVVLKFITDKFVGIVPVPSTPFI